MSFCKIAFMRNYSYVLVVAFFVLLTCFNGNDVHAQATTSAKVDFNRQIRPILSDRCFFCHGPDSEHREADLRLDLEASAKESAIVPGDPDSSELIARIISDDHDTLMPPPESNKELSDEDIKLLRQWIKEGADWSQHWAYVPPKKSPEPKTSDQLWKKNWIDSFILARLEKEKLSPAPDADPITLIRRVYFDLTGLPPTPDQVDKFVANPTDAELEKIVDRLLESKQYGERMAMYWLDLVRYADTVGYHGDQDQNISPYREYVINSFNTNKKLDQFTVEQLAGDLLANPTVEQKIATGYNRLLQTTHEGGLQPKEYLAIYAADRIRNVSNVWMGATMGCCQCHDHKYDPYSIEDFYSMVAFFADIDEAQHFKVGTNSLPTRRPPEIELYTDQQNQQVSALNEGIKKLTLELKAKDLDAKKKKELSDRLKSQQKKLSNVRRSVTKSMITVSVKPREIRVLPRGDWLDESGKVVTPSIPKFLGNIDKEQRLTRLDLANWFVAKDGYGLMTARVFANRFWYLMLGSGFSKVLDDFGGQGEPPTHAELLDNLALEFFESGWDVKQTLKLIVMSRTYRQSSIGSDSLRAKDPDNRLYARQSSFRLPAETIRDNSLSISGLLNLEYGGPSVKPYQPAGYYRHLNFPTRRYAAHLDRRQYRRGVYIHWQRMFLHPMLKAFDAPSREECTAQRTKSNTPLASLILLNDPTYVESARVFAEMIMVKGGKSFASKTDFAFRRATSRNATAKEVKILKGLFEETVSEYQADPALLKSLRQNGFSKPNEKLDAIQVGGWTAVARVILNLSETNFRN